MKPCEALPLFKRGHTIGTLPETPLLLPMEEQNFTALRTEEEEEQEFPHNAAELNGEFCGKKKNPIWTLPHTPQPQKSTRILFSVSVGPCTLPAPAWFRLTALEPPQPAPYCPHFRCFCSQQSGISSRPSNLVDQELPQNVS